MGIQQTWHRGFLVISLGMHGRWLVKHTEATPLTILDSRYLPKLLPMHGPPAPIAGPAPSERRSVTGLRTLYERRPAGAANGWPDPAAANGAMPAHGRRRDFLAAAKDGEHKEKKGNR